MYYISLDFLKDNFQFQLNGSHSDEFVVDTGLNDIDLVNEVLIWRGNEYVQSI